MHIYARQPKERGLWKSSIYFWIYTFFTNETSPEKARGLIDLILQTLPSDCGIDGTNSDNNCNVNEYYNCNLGHMNLKRLL